VLRRIFGDNSDEMTGGRIKLHMEELHNLYPSPKIIRMITERRMTRTMHVVHEGDGKFIQNFGWKAEGNRPVIRPRHK
jgi:hypothetical protein